MIKLHENDYVVITGTEVKNDNGIYIVNADYSIKDKYAKYAENSYCLYKVKIDGSLSKTKYNIFFLDERSAANNPNMIVEKVSKENLKEARKKVTSYLKDKKNTGRNYKF